MTAPDFAHIAMSTIQPSATLFEIWWWVAVILGAVGALFGGHHCEDNLVEIRGQELTTPAGALLGLLAGAAWPLVLVGSALLLVFAIFAMVTVGARDLALIAWSFRPVRLPKSNLPRAEVRK